MRKLSLLLAVGTLALGAARLQAQTATATAVAGRAEAHATCYGALGAIVTCADATHGLPVAPAASSATPLIGSVTSSDAALTSTPAGASCSFASGTGICGPFLPQVGLPIRLILGGGASYSGYLGTTTGSDCSSISQLTPGGFPLNFTSSYNDYVDIPPTSGGVKYCLRLTVSSGTQNFVVRQ